MTRSTLLLATLFSTLALGACRAGELADDGDHDAGPEAATVVSSSGSGSSTSSSGSGQGVPPSSGSSSGSSGGTGGGAPCTGAGGSRGPTGTPVVLATVAGPSMLAIDCANLYVAPYEIGVVTAVSLADGTTTALNPVAATTVAIDATHVYSVSPGGGDEPQGLVVACPKTGCNPSYTTIATGQTNVWGIATDGESVLWTNQGAPGAVMKAPVTGGPATTLVAEGSADDIAIVGNRVIYTGFVTGGSGLLMSVPLAGGAPTVLFTPTNGNSVEGLAVDAANVYFTTTDGLVAQMPLAGGPLVTLATGQGNGIMGITVDAQDVYWAAWETGSIVKTPNRRRRGDAGRDGPVQPLRHRRGREQRLLDQHGRRDGDEARQVSAS